MDEEFQARAISPAKSWQKIAPTTAIVNPQIKSRRNKTFDSAGSLTAATHSAPSVESGDTSTSADPTLMLSATASGSPPPSCSTSFGAVGRKAGSTTPDVLL